MSENGISSSDFLIRCTNFAAMLRISYCPYRLLFKHPFETSHGIREGTDSIFIRLEENGLAGYGEVTLPPYLKEKPKDVLERLLGSEMSEMDSSDKVLAYLNVESNWKSHQQGCRAALQSAWIDLVGNRTHETVSQILDTEKRATPLTMMTIGITPIAELGAKLLEMPESDVLKVKMTGPESIPMLRAILDVDDRPVFIDANQGLNSVEEAELIQAKAHERLIAMEQPFQLKDKVLQHTLQTRSKFCIYGDEAIESLAELETAKGLYGGVNIKLMKCGGLDRAKAMADRAEDLGMKVMLGSMSESSLGCTAMAHLSGQADLVDLDGPWLIENDPFEGMGMKNGMLVMPDRPGIGAVLKAELVFKPICT